MKTRQPLIVTARITDSDLEPFDRLRQAHFPADRNFLRAHMTMFHRLPGEYEARIVDTLNGIVQDTDMMIAEVSGVRHLGAGVAYAITCPQLLEIRAAIAAELIAWLGPQDRQKWQPHITVQNKVSKQRADDLYHSLSQTFQPHPIHISGLDVWQYLGGPWQHTTTVQFGRGS